MLNWCDSFNGSIVTVYRYDKLLITGYNYVQDVDSTVGAIDLSIAKGNLEANLRN